MGPEKQGSVWRYDVLGYTFAGTIVLFAGLGYLLDGWLGFAPLFTIVGTLTGATLAFVRVYLKVRQDDRASAAHRRGTDADPE